MNIKHYAKYKESDIEWLGVVPEHWRIVRLRFLCHITTGDRDNIHKDPDGSFPFFVRSKKVERINSYSFDGEAVLTAGDGDIGKIFHHANGKFDFHQRVYKFSKFNGITGRFFFHHISAHLADEVIKLSAKTTVDSLRLPMLQNFTFALPQIKEQTQIANFLDRETAKIDTLIKKQQQLIKLLQEKRQAVISRAVTKGLDPNAKMKESGVEWLGTVPEHWHSQKVGYMFKQAKRQNFPDCEVLSVYRDYGVIRKSSRDDNNNKTPDNLSLYQLVEVGDLVVNKMKAWQGSMGISEHEGITSPDYIVYSPMHGELDQFVHHAFRAKHMPDVYKVISNGVRPAQWRLEPEKFAQLVFYFPPLDEQKAIVHHIEHMNIKYAKLIEKANCSIELLEERRTALISAAVTGKIDVRNAA